VSPSSPTGHSTALASSKTQQPSERSARRGTAPKRRRKPAPGLKLIRHDRSLGFRYVAGADEAGRGCLAGPIVAAGVLLDFESMTAADEKALRSLNDSKQQSHEARAALYPVIMRVATKVHIVSRSAASIDARGLHKTNLACLHEALAAVARPGCICLSDGFPVAQLAHEQRAVVKGDATSAAIAAASVIAKETRDRYMRRVDERIPGWGFASHVGYASPEHRSAIERHGPTDLHRMSFQSIAYQQLSLG
jgi:ribonuclease HII